MERVMNAEHQNRVLDARHPASRRVASHSALLPNGRFPESKKTMDGLFTTASNFEVSYMRLLLILSLLILSSCSYVRTAMVTTMDVITAPYHYIVDDEEDDPMAD